MNTKQMCGARRWHYNHCLFMIMKHFVTVCSSMNKKGTAKMIASVLLKKYASGFFFAQVFN
jgi:hypothetical protein